MKEKILICRRNPNNSLTVLDEKKLMTYLDETTMEVYTVYRGLRYTVEGNIYAAYIVIA